MKVCVICSAGGHLSEAIECVSKLTCSIYYITYAEPHAISRLVGKRADYVIDPHNSIVKYLLNFFQSLRLYFKERPDVVLTTGSGIALATCFIAKALGKKIIYIESGARITTQSKTGRLLYRIADVFIVQWEQQLQFYPRAKYVGSLI